MTVEQKRALALAAARQRAAEAETVTEPEESPPRKLKADQGLGLAEGLKRPLDNAATWLRNAVPEPVRNAVDAADRAIGSVGLPAAVQQRQDELAKAATEGRRPGAIGEAVGGAIAGFPLLAATRNPWLAGAGSGAISTRDPNKGGSVALDAAVGGATGGVSDIGLRAAGSVIAPRINPLVQRLLDRGVELTPGQILGGLPHRLEDATRSVLGVGDMVVGAQANAQRSLNRAVVQSALDPVGVKIPKNIPEGHAQIQYAGDALSNAYNGILAKIDASAAPTGSKLPTTGPLPTGLKLDAQFAQNVASLRQLARGLPADQRHVFESFVQNEMRHGVNPQTGSISGRAMKDLDSLIGQRAAQFRASPNPHDRDMARAFSELQSELRDMVKRQFPQHGKTIDALNEGWAKLIRAETAAAPAKGGVFTPEALRSATRSTDRSTRHRASARGEAMLQDFADAAAQRMNPTTGDSGTAGRLIANTMVGAALFKGNPLEHLQLNPWALSVLAAVSAPYANRTTGAIARAILTRRPNAAPAARRALERVAPGVAVAAGQEPARRRK